MKVTTFHSLHSRDWVKYRAEIHRSPVWKHAAYEAYHFYDSRIPVRIPGWSRFEGWLRKRGAHMDLGRQDRIRDRLVSWTINQDVRCYEISEWAHDPIASIEIDEETYEKVKKG